MERIYEARITNDDELHMRILVGCEESGNMRDAFAKRGHDAWSNDLIPARRGGKHLEMDVIDAITKYGPWDIIILHPDCSAMSLSGNRWYGNGMPLHNLRLEAIKWTAKLWEIAKKHSRVGCAIENPTSVLWKAIGKPQYVQPYDFGHGETKKTGFLTDRLPLLNPTKKVDGREHRVWRMPPGANRKRDRAESYPGICEACAEQWGGLENVRAD